jgi:hypothetical protein
MNRIFSVGILLWAVFLLLLPPTLFAQGWDHYKYSQPVDQMVPVPDVNKPDRDGDGLWPDAIDMSCWQAAAANLLGAAGYGTNLANNTPQGRANAIYAQMNADLGIQNLGCADLAINYWLYTYGKNPNSPDFQPTNPYTDLTLKVNYAGLGIADYNFLMNELDRCQYVAVSFDYPPHCMTLVGGNAPVPPAANPNWTAQSVWHDSDWNNVHPGDDVRTSVFGNTWDLIDNGVTYESNAQKYITFCKGLNKNETAMRNYDVAYFNQDPDQDGNWTPGFREAGAKAPVYADPAWSTNPNEHVVQIGNERINGMSKEIYLLVDYYDRVQDRAAMESLTLKAIDAAGTEVELSPTNVTPSDDDGQLLFYWKLDFQPDWEQIVFPDAKYETLAGNVKDWDVATNCVPEPGVLVLLGVAVLTVIPRLRRRK